MAQFASETTVTSEKSRMEIEATLRRYGADSFGYMSDPGRAMVAFAAHNRRIRFEIKLPQFDDDEFKWTSHKSRQRRSPEAQKKAHEQGVRQRWRALALVVKAKLEAVDAGISTFEEEFMAHIVLPDGSTMADKALPYIAEAYASGKTVPLLGKF